MSPAARSAAVISASASGRIANVSSCGTTRRRSVPIPAMRRPFSMLLCACDVAYATRRDASPSVLTAPLVMRHRAARIDANVASLADPWITPPPLGLVERNCSGNPSSSCIQSTINVSTSVHAGPVTQLMPCTPSPAVSRSPRIAGYDELAGKYAKKLGCCQWVNPGTMTRSVSAITASNPSGVVGGCSASCARTSPGWTVDVTRCCSMFSMYSAIQSIRSWPCFLKSSGVTRQPYLSSAMPHRARLPGPAIWLPSFSRTWRCQRRLASRSLGPYPRRTVGAVPDT